MDKYPLRKIFYFIIRYPLKIFKPGIRILKDGEELRPTISPPTTPMPGGCSACSPSAIRWRRPFLPSPLCFSVSGCCLSPSPQISLSPWFWLSPQRALPSLVWETTAFPGSSLPGGGGNGERRSSPSGGRPRRAKSAGGLCNGTERTHLRTTSGRWPILLQTRQSPGGFSWCSSTRAG